MEQQQQQVKSFESKEEEEEQERVTKLLEERLVKHDDNRKAVQDKLKEVRDELMGQIDELEGRITRELDEKSASEDNRLQAAFNELRGNSTCNALQKAKRGLCVVQSYEIIENQRCALSLKTLYKLKAAKRNAPEVGSVGPAIPEADKSVPVPSSTTEKCKIPYSSDKLAEERGRLIRLLEERLEAHDSNRKAAQDKLHEICEGLRVKVDELEDRINKDLEDKFTFEDSRLQAALNELRGSRTASALQKVQAELLVEQSYEVIKNNFDSKLNLITLYELKAERRIVPELLEARKPTNVRITGVNKGSVSVQFTSLNPDEERVLSDKAIVNLVKYQCLLFERGNEQEGKEYPLDENEGDSSFPFTSDILEAETTYGIRVKTVVCDRESEWSDDIAEFTTPEFKEWCLWRKCPDDVDDWRKYSVDEKNLRVVTKTKEGGYYSNSYCTIIGNTCIPLNKVTSWSIKILKSKGSNEDNIYIGVAPNDINQNYGYNNDKCGWYFGCYSLKLRSGPLHDYDGKEYGPRKERWGRYVHDGDSVGVVMDTTKGDLSFVLDGVNLGVAYEGISLDKPLVPCVLLRYDGDSVELDTSEVKENVDSSVPVSSNITIKDTTWDSITVAWDEVAGASFYQIEMNKSKSCYATTRNAFTKRGLLPETEHSFRVRTVRGSSAGEWSGVVKGRTQKAPEFSECVWKECPGDVANNNKYSVDGRNPRVATMDGYNWCTIIGNTHIPLNNVTSWNIMIHKSMYNNGNNIFIGIAPFDIDQNEDNCCYYGWYFNCYSSTSWSGPPHNYRGKDYGPRKGDGQYVHDGDSVGVVMDTTKGELLFVLNNVNLGVAFEGIPLGKPLVPCVILGHVDTVELIV